ncbi:MAG: hypothetical protein LBB24_02295, partial [Rickettsiales bacterium]|nr:hypothetical protein [Rickettsiales bacterium]
MRNVNFSSCFRLFLLSLVFMFPCRSGNASTLKSSEHTELRTRIERFVQNYLKDNIVMNGEETTRRVSSLVDPILRALTLISQKLSDSEELGKVINYIEELKLNSSDLDYGECLRHIIISIRDIGNGLRLDIIEDDVFSVMYSRYVKFIIYLNNDNDLAPVIYKPILEFQTRKWGSLFGNNSREVIDLVEWAVRLFRLSMSFFKDRSCSDVYDYLEKAILLANSSSLDWFTGFMRKIIELAGQIWEESQTYYDKREKNLVSGARRGDKFPELRLKIMRRIVLGKYSAFSLISAPEKKSLMSPETNRENEDYKGWDEYLGLMSEKIVEYYLPIDETNGGKISLDGVTIIEKLLKSIRDLLSNIKMLLIPMKSGEIANCISKLKKISGWSSENTQWLIHSLTPISYDSSDQQPAIIPESMIPESDDLGWLEKFIHSILLVIKCLPHKQSLESDLTVVTDYEDILVQYYDHNEPIFGVDAMSDSLFIRMVECYIDFIRHFDESAGPRWMLDLLSGGEKSLEEAVDLMLQGERDRELGTGEKMGMLTKSELNRNSEMNAPNSSVSSSSGNDDLIRSSKSCFIEPLHRNPASIWNGATHRGVERDKNSLLGSNSQYHLGEDVSNLISRLSFLPEFTNLLCSENTHSSISGLDRENLSVSPQNILPERDDEDKSGIFAHLASETREIIKEPSERMVPKDLESAKESEYTIYINRLLSSKLPRYLTSDDNFSSSRNIFGMPRSLAMQLILSGISGDKLILSQEQTERQQQDVIRFAVLIMAEFIAMEALAAPDTAYYEGKFRDYIDLLKERKLSDLDEMVQWIFHSMNYLLPVVAEPSATQSKFCELVLDTLILYQSFFLKNKKCLTNKSPEWLDVGIGLWSSRTLGGRGERIKNIISHNEDIKKITATLTDLVIKIINVGEEKDMISLSIPECLADFVSMIINIISIMQIELWGGSKSPEDLAPKLQSLKEKLTSYQYPDSGDKPSAIFDDFDNFIYEIFLLAQQVLELRTDHRALIELYMVYGAFNKKYMADRSKWLLVIKQFDLSGAVRDETDNKSSSSESERGATNESTDFYEVVSFSIVDGQPPSTIRVKNKEVKTLLLRISKMFDCLKLDLSGAIKSSQEERLFSAELVSLKQDMQEFIRNIGPVLDFMDQNSMMAIGKIINSISLTGAKVLALNKKSYKQSSDAFEKLYREVSSKYMTWRSKLLSDTDSDDSARVSLNREDDKSSGIVDDSTNYQDYVDKIENSEEMLKIRDRLVFIVSGIAAGGIRIENDSIIMTLMGSMPIIRGMVTVLSSIKAELSMNSESSGGLTNVVRGKLELLKDGIFRDEVRLDFGTALDDFICGISTIANDATLGLKRSRGRFLALVNLYRSFNAQYMAGKSKLASNIESYRSTVSNDRKKSTNMGPKLYKIEFLATNLLISAIITRNREIGTFLLYVSKLLKNIRLRLQLGMEFSESLILYWVELTRLESKLHKFSNGAGPTLDFIDKNAEVAIDDIVYSISLIAAKVLKSAEEYEQFVVMLRLYHDDFSAKHMTGKSKWSFSIDSSGSVKVSLDIKDSGLSNIPPSLINSDSIKIKPVASNSRWSLAINSNGQVELSLNTENDVLSVAPYDSINSNNIRIIEEGPEMLEIAHKLASVVFDIMKNKRDRDIDMITSASFLIYEIIGLLSSVRAELLSMSPGSPEELATTRENLKRLENGLHENVSKNRKIDDNITTLDDFVQNAFSIARNALKLEENQERFLYLPGIYSTFRIKFGYGKFPAWIREISYGNDQGIERENEIDVMSIMENIVRNSLGRKNPVGGPTDIKNDPGLGSFLKKLADLITKLIADAESELSPNLRPPKEFRNAMGAFRKARRELISNTSGTPEFLFYNFVRRISIMFDELPPSRSNIFREDALKLLGLHLEFNDKYMLGSTWSRRDNMRRASVSDEGHDELYIGLKAMTIFRGIARITNKIVLSADPENMSDKLSISVSSFIDAIRLNLLESSTPSEELSDVGRRFHIVKSIFVEHSHRSAAYDPGLVMDDFIYNISKIATDMLALGRNCWQFLTDATTLYSKFNRQYLGALSSWSTYRSDSGFAVALGEVDDVLFSGELLFNYSLDSVRISSITKAVNATKMEGYMEKIWGFLDTIAKTDENSGPEIVSMNRKLGILFVVVIAYLEQALSDIKEIEKLDVEKSLGASKVVSSKTAKKTLEAGPEKILDSLMSNIRLALRKQPWEKSLGTSNVGSSKTAKKTSKADSEKILDSLMSDVRLAFQKQLEFGFGLLEFDLYFVGLDRLYSKFREKYIEGSGHQRRVKDAGRSDSSLGLKTYLDIVLEFIREKIKQINKDCSSRRVEDILRFLKGRDNISSKETSEIKEFLRSVILLAYRLADNLPTDTTGLNSQIATSNRPTIGNILKAATPKNLNWLRSLVAYCVRESVWHMYAAPIRRDLINMLRMYITFSKRYMGKNGWLLATEDRDMFLRMTMEIPVEGMVRYGNIEVVLMPTGTLDNLDNWPGADTVAKWEKSVKEADRIETERKEREKEE